jgi:hypothetical protein
MRGIRCAAGWAVLIVLTAGTATAAPATAQVPEASITVIPSTGLTDGATAEAVVEGLGVPWLTAQCTTDVLDELETGVDFGPCRLASDITSGSPLTVESVFVAINGDIVRCGVEPDDCAIVAFSATSGPPVGTTISMVPPPAFELFDTEQEAGLPVRAAVTVAPGTSVEVAQCVSPIGPDAGSSTCSPAQAVTVDERGFADVSFPLVESVTGPGGTYSCVDDPCVVAAFDGSGTTLGSARSRLGGPTRWRSRSRRPSASTTGASSTPTCERRPATSCTPPSARRRRSTIPVWVPAHASSGSGCSWGPGRA